MQLLPGWLAALVVVRDVGQIGVTVGYRVSMFGGRWPGLAALLDVDNEPAAAPDAGGSRQQQQQQEEGVDSSSSSSGAAGAEEAVAEGEAAPSQPLPAAGAPDMPRIHPLFISKLNTALAFVLAGGCIAQQWQGVPGAEVLQGLEVAVGGTTAASGLAYLWLYRQGRLYQK